MSAENLPVVPVLDCDGFRRLKAAVDKDDNQPTATKWHDYLGKLAWVVARAQHYADKTGLSAEAILDAWEKRRDYWYMNYYQECNQPLIKGENVRVFETQADLLASIGATGFRCPACAGVSKSPYECSAGTVTKGKKCDWKSWGLFHCLGKGASVFVKEKLAGETFFMPVAWEADAMLAARKDSK